MPCTCCICKVSKDLDPTSVRPEMRLSSDIYPITHNGKPTGRTLAFICARCLERANDMRVHIKSIRSNVKVTRHAVERFLERGEHMPEASAASAIIKIFSQARKIVYQECFMVERLANHGHPADYWYSQGFIFVATRDDPATILTVERQGEKRRGRDFWYVNDDGAACAVTNRHD